MLWSTELPATSTELRTLSTVSNAQFISRMCQELMPLNQSEWFHQQLLKVKLERPEDLQLPAIGLDSDDPTAPEAWRAVQENERRLAAPFVRVYEHNRQELFRARNTYVPFDFVMTVH